MALMYAVMFFAAGRNRRAAVLGLAASYSNIVVLELVTLKEKVGQQGHPAKIMAASIWNTLKQPMIFPNILGLLYSQTGWGIPAVIDKPLQLLGNAFSPLAVILVGITLVNTRAGEHLRMALGLSLLKNIAHPLAVMIVTASLPIGANVFLFAQRYETALPEVTAAVAVSTGVALVSVASPLAGLVKADTTK